jgi:signal transduction histidine kinase
MNALRSPLMRQMALIISLLIIGIEGVLLYTSVQSKRRELENIRQSIDKKVMETSDKSFSQLYPGILDDQDIKRRMKDYTRNIILLTLLITVVVALGSMLIFYNKAGRFLVKLKHLNTIGKVKIKDIPRFPLNEIPNNEIGDLIKSREIMLVKLQEYEEHIEEKLKEAEKNIIQSAKMSLVGEFTAGIIHDIKNPLTVIITYSQLLKDSKKRKKMDSNKVDRNLEKIHLSAQKLHKLVDRMGSFGRTQLNYKEGINLNMVIKNSLLFTQTKIKKVGVTINQILPENTFLYGDENSLEQVVTNLISNACDAMENSVKKELTIFADEINEKIILEISDTGSGMDESTLVNAFNSFFTTKQEGKGTGLGLANVAQIISKHQGEINVDSTPNKGTTFVIILNKKKPKEFVESISA